MKRDKTERTKSYTKPREQIHKEQEQREEKYWTNTWYKNKEKQTNKKNHR